MTESIFHGPLVGAGSLLNSKIQPDDGPAINYQGDSFPDPRQTPLNKDGTSPGRVRSYFVSAPVVLTDTIPSASSTTTVFAALAPSTTVGVALGLTTAVIGTAAGVPVWTPGIPIVVAATTGIPTSTVTTVSVIDFGFATGTTTANNSTVIVNNNVNFYAGQWIVIGGAGSGSATNVALFTQVQSLSTNNNSFIITISPTPATGLSHAPIGQGNLYSQFLPPATQFGPSAASANAAEPYRIAGLGLAFDPSQAMTRVLTVTAASIGSGTTAFTVSGYDVYGVPMTELITANGTTTVAGKKAFKYVNTIVVAAAATSGTPAAISVGLGDSAGINLRSDRWEALEIAYNGGWGMTSAGWSSALSTTASTSTVDVRGLINASTMLFGSSAGSAAVGAPFDGVKRFVVSMQVPASNMLNATPLNAKSLYGTAQV